MARPRRRTLTRKPPANAPEPPPEPPRPFAVVDLGASAVRLAVAEVQAGAPPRILEEASRGILLGKDTFTHGRLGATTVEATLKVLEGFRRIMDTYGVVRYRAIATSAIREASNRETFLDRVRLRTGIEMEVIDGTEENRLTYVAVRETLRDHEAFTAGDAVLIAGGLIALVASFLVSYVRAKAESLGVAVLDDPVVLPDGTPVRVEVECIDADFWRGKTLEELAREQDVKPCTNPADLAIDWPEEDSVDEFLALIREIRK